MPKFTEIDDEPRRIFAVGDIHGCSEELSVLLEHLERQEGLTQDDLVIFVGDYIDRGPDSKGVIDVLLTFQQRFPETVFLRGNHEDMLLNYVGYGGTHGDAYLYNGGKDLLTSYGILDAIDPGTLRERLPARHTAFYFNLTSYVITPRFVFVHAGLHPLRDLYAQMDKDLFWIRDEFIMNVHRFNRTVVFGHTPFEDVLLNLPYKIGVDTGLVFGNRLSCLEVQSGRLIQVPRFGKQVGVGSVPLSR